MCKVLADKFDQFYTKQDIAVNCCLTLNKKFEGILDFQHETFLEPSAGTGAFIDAIKTVINDDINLDAFDIDPKHKLVKKADFLKQKLSKEYITIGNPPFGKRSSLAIEFFNKAAQNSKIIAFIVPLQFDKYSVQRHLDPRFKLIHSEILIPDAFIYNDKSYKVRCCFQIWTTLDTPYENLRIMSAPEISHPDFEMFQYNNTQESLKYFDKEKYMWDFAVYRQGFYDYTERIEDASQLKRNVQYIFFKAKTPKTKALLYGLDFERLSQKNTTIPGFGKADVVKYYKEVMAR